MKSTGDGPIQIIIGGNATSMERIAAEDMRYYIGELTGLPAEVSQDPTGTVISVDKPTFVIGTPRTSGMIARLVERGALELPKDLGEQGLCIRNVQMEGDEWIVLYGQEPVGAMYAVYHFLERACGVGFFTDGDRIPRQENLAFGEVNEVVQPHFKVRGYMTHPNWTRPYIHCCQLWSFEEWKRQIDWMRRKRFNVLVLFHDEGTYLWGDVIFRAFPEIRKDAKALEKFVVDPAYRTELNQRIVRYARESGIAVAYNLMYSQVPDFFQWAHPELTYHVLQMENVGICASQPACRETMRRFWGKIIETCGIDESHIYIVCPYQHEVDLCSHFPTSAPVAVQAWEVLREIDPQARVFVESWCWGRYWMKRDKPGEWQDFLRVTPEEVGVADLDTEFTKTPEREELFHWFHPRQWLAMKLLTFETCYPPSFLQTTPRSVIDDVRAAADHGAEGVIAFNIIANSNTLLCDLSAELGWAPYRSEESYIEDYVRQRHGTLALPAMVESQKLQIAAADGALRIASGEICFPAETELYRKAGQGDEGLDAWIEERLKLFRQKHECAVKAREIALAQAGTHQNDLLYAHDLWELTYTVARWEGCIQFYEAYRSIADIECSDAHFQEALKQFFRIKVLFADQPDYSMEHLRELGNGVAYLPHFLERWNTISRRWVDIRPYYYMVLEHFDRYEELLRSMAPHLV